MTLQCDIIYKFYSRKKGKKYKKRTLQKAGNSGWEEVESMAESSWTIDTCIPDLTRGLRHIDLP